MVAADMKTAILAALNAEFGTDYEDVPDSHELSGYDRATYNDRYWGAVCSAMITYITTNARCSGTDSRGDTHDAVQIV